MDRVAGARDPRCSPPAQMAALCYVPARQVGRRALARGYMADLTVIATAAVSGAVGILAALVGAYATTRVAKLETLRKNREYQQTRRSERQATYQAAIDLLTDWGWRTGASDFDVVRDFTIPFVRCANKVRVYESPASIVAIDELQVAFAKLNAAQTEAEIEAAYAEIAIGHDHLVTAARADVGPRPEDGLANVPFRPGAGPKT
jgi:hypothetical protein